MARSRVRYAKALFREGSGGGALLGNRCTSCGQIFFPKAKLCQACLHEELKEVPLSRKGKLYSYTIAHMPSYYVLFHPVRWASSICPKASGSLLH